MLAERINIPKKKKIERKVSAEFCTSICHGSKLYTIDVPFHLYEIINECVRPGDLTHMWECVYCLCLVSVSMAEKRKQEKKIPYGEQNG